MANKPKPAYKVGEEITLHINGKEYAGAVITSVSWSDYDNDWYYAIRTSTHIYDITEARLTEFIDQSPKYSVGDIVKPNAQAIANYSDIPRTMIVRKVNAMHVGGTYYDCSPLDDNRTYAQWRLYEYEIEHNLQEQREPLDTTSLEANPLYGMF